MELSFTEMERTVGGAGLGQGIDYKFIYSHIKLKMLDRCPIGDVQ